MRDRAGNGGGDHLVGARRNSHHGRNIVENQQRRDQKAAAHAEHAGKKTDGRAHAENDENIHRQFCDRQIDSHGSDLGQMVPGGRACPGEGAAPRFTLSV
ncbi:hypothetical protein D3C78_1446160 [compost metagenome]